MRRFFLQKRDVRVLINVYQHAFLLRDHIWQLHFTDCGLRRAMRRLHLMTEQGLLVAHTLPLGAFPLGIGEEFVPHVGQFAYRLGTSAIPVVAQALEIDQTAVRRRLHTSPSYLGHAVAVATLHVALHRFQTEQGYSLRDFRTEGEARHTFEWRNPASADWQRTEVRPDALVRVVLAERTIPILFEADMATQSQAAFRAKLENYALYRRTPVFAQRFSGAAFRLFIVTTSPARRDVLAALVSESDLSALPGVALTTFADFLYLGPFGPIWHCPALGAERNRPDVLSHL